jgi:FAD synthase
VASGTFDGTHRGRCELIGRIALLGLSAVAVTFNPRPAVAFGRVDPARDFSAQLDGTPRRPARV